jgi:hypothetical protein
VADTGIEATQQNYTEVLIRLHKDRQALSQLKTVDTHGLTPVVLCGLLG